MRVALPAPCPSARAAGALSQRPNRRTVTVQAYQQAGEQVGDKILNKLRTPLDLLALPGRVAVGALQSLPEVVQSIPGDLERLQRLASDPRPAEEKQQEVLAELETRVVGYLDKGTNVEADVLNNINSLLPQEVKNALPPDMKEFLEKPHLHVEDQHGYSAGPMTTTVMMGDSDNEFDMPITMTPSEIAASQIASEMEELKAAVLELQSQLESLRANTDPTRTNMLKVNVREARDALQQHLQQLSPAALGTNDPPAQAAIREAQQLLGEVSAVF